MSFDANKLKTIKTRARAGVQRGAIGIQAEMKLMLSKPGKGEKRGKYRASAPGDPPTVQTGNLRRSVQVADLSTEKVIKARVGTNQDYGRFLEYGTKRIAPRPWARPSVVLVKPKLLQYMVRSADAAGGAS